MRGSPYGRRLRAACAGIIPAGAGLTGNDGWKEHRQGDHPRGCGAHVFSSPADIGGWGSSPRVRGSHIGKSGQDVFDGIIPAGAGLTASTRSSLLSGRDHPRGCGAHAEVDAELVAGWGSSPRVRGSLDFAPIEVARAGIIPAGAGLT